MAKRNQYSFSKRQRELKKKKKQEEKRARKQAKNAPEVVDDELAPGEEYEGEMEAGTDAEPDPERPETRAE